MEDIVVIMLFVGGWLLLQLVVLPRLGFNT